MSDLELCKLRTASPASGTVELIRRCLWAHDRLTLAADRIEALEATSFRLTEERDRAISWRDHDKERAERAEARIEAAESLAKAVALHGEKFGLTQPVTEALVAYREASK